MTSFLAGCLIIPERQWKGAENNEAYRTEQDSDS